LTIDDQRKDKRGRSKNDRDGKHGKEPMLVNSNPPHIPYDATWDKTRQPASLKSSASRRIPKGRFDRLRVVACCRPARVRLRCFRFIGSNTKVRQSTSARLCLMAVILTCAPPVVRGSKALSGAPVPTAHVPTADLRHLLCEPSGNLALVVSDALSSGTNRVVLLEQVAESTMSSTASSDYVRQ
jgi:hypothetical protein